MKYRYHLIALLFFMLDKIVLIPYVKENLTDAALANPNQETYNDLDVQCQEGAARHVWVLGTSRSLGFYFVPVPRNTVADRFTTPAEKSRINAADIQPHASPGSNPAVFLTRYLEMRRRNCKPDEVWIEVSPFSYNTEQYPDTDYFFHNSEVVKYEGIPLDFALRHYDLYPVNYLWDIAVSRMFAMTRYRLVIGGHRRNNMDDFVAALLRRAAEVKVDRLLTDLDFGDFPAADTAGIFGLSFGVPVIVKEYQGDWRPNENHLAMLRSLVRTANLDRVRIVLWQPPVHPNLRRTGGRYQVAVHWQPRIRQIAREYGGVFVDLNDPAVMKCDYYKDPGHLSPRCFTELSAVLLGARTAGN